MDKKKVQEGHFKSKRVLMRVDLNVPLDSRGHITDDTRLKAILPTLTFLLREGASVVLIAHLGRPKGKQNETYSLKHVLPSLSQLLGQKIYFVNDCIGDNVQKMKADLKPQEVLLCENLRFYLAEENPSLDPSFAKQLAEGCNAYVNDAFSCAHRSHSSITEVTRFFPNEAYMGFSLEQEEQFLKKKLLHPDRPFIAVIGGAKISSKIGVLLSLIDKADALLIGGAMAHTFLKAKGISIGKSLNEAEFEEKAKEILILCEKKNVPLVLPVDLWVAKEIREDSRPQVVSIELIPEEEVAGDVGPQTLELYKKFLKKGKTVFWNGPLGVAEFEPFSKGTRALAQCLGELDAITIVGGGDSTAVLKNLGLESKVTYISTGGGASLEYIEQGFLPGIEALSTKN